MTGIANRMSQQQYTPRSREQVGDSSVPAINVQEAFVGGGSDVGLANNVTNRYELQNVTSWVDGPHTWKAGGRARYNSTSDIAPTNFSGTFIFASLEQYRSVLQQVPGARPAQFTRNSGDPQAGVRRFDFGGFIQDDWRVRPDFTLSYGLRYEIQTNISDWTNFAPRLSFAWAPGAKAGGKAPATVIRGGAGIFYYRFSEDLTLLAHRFNGTGETQFIVTNPDFFPRVPSAAELLSTAQKPTVRHVAADSKAPSAYRATLSLEHQLPRNTVLTVSYIFKRDEGIQ